jgi:hypothetical protein
VREQQTYIKAIKKNLILQGEPVHICGQDMSGKNRWVIRTDEDHIWISHWATAQRAERYCVRMGLPYTFIRPTLSIAK